MPWRPVVSSALGGTKAEVMDLLGTAFARSALGISGADGCDGLCPKVGNVREFSDDGERCFQGQHVTARAPLVSRDLSWCHTIFGGLMRVKTATR